MSRSSPKSPQGQSFLPRYELLAPLGEGAAATVYKVRSTKDDALRALKALKPDQPDLARAIERFEDEYRILSGLHFPCLPEVFDYGIAVDGTRYIVMELVEGVALDEYFSTHTGELWLLLYELAEALTFVHEHELLHLDLKPGNVLVRRTRAFGTDESPLITLIDFGLSYRREGGGEVKMVGSADTMAPEMIRGDEGLTRAADYYSLGAIIYELIEGQPPFEGSAYEKMQAHLTKPVTFAQQKVEYAELYGWVEKLMAKEATPRLEAFEDFRRAISARLGETTEDLNRVFALGYIDSMGLIGKDDVWAELQEWIGKVKALGARKARSTPKKARATAARKVSEATDIDARIREELLEALPKEVPEEAPPEELPPRCRVVSGAPESGKSYFLETLEHDLRTQGVTVVPLRDALDYRSIVGDRGRAARRRTDVDPASIVLDRFIQGWNRLKKKAGAATTVLLVDDFDALDREEREFVAYIAKRIDLAEASEDVGRLCVVIGGDAARIKPEVFRELSDKAYAVSELPPPGAGTVEQVVGKFHGHLSGRDERRRLAEFLGADLSGVGAMVTALQEAVTERALRYAGGDWHFIGSTTERRERGHPRTGYFRRIFQELPDQGKQVMTWLCCQRGMITLSALEKLSGLSPSALKGGVETVAPYRLLRIEDSGEGPHLGIANENIRAACSELVDNDERPRIHQAYLAYLSENQSDSADWFEAMAFHHAGTGSVREPVVMRLRALGVAHEARDVFRVRRLCDESIRYIRSVMPDDDPTRWPRERYFIKVAINNEWLIGNFGELVTIVKRWFDELERELPLSFAYRYATALERTGDLNGSRQVAKHARELAEGTCAETVSNLIIVEATAHNLSGDHTGALDLLKEVPENILHGEVLSRFHALRMLIYASTGQQAERDEAIRAVETIASRFSRYDLMRAHYTRINMLINTARYSEARRSLRRAVRLCHNYRLRRNLYSMHFLACVMYYSQQKFERSLRSLQRALNAATSAGLVQLTNYASIRFATIYQSMGRYDAALQIAESARARIPKALWHDDYFYSTVTLCDVLVSMNSPEASSYRDELANLASNTETRPILAYYHRVLGGYHETRGDLTEALNEYKEALDLNLKIGYDDDIALRRVNMARVHLGLGDYQATEQYLNLVAENIEALGSALISAEYYAVRLEFHTASNDGSELHRLITVCEPLRSEVENINTLLRMESSLFRAYRCLGDYVGATACFENYYTKMKEIASSIAGEARLREFLNNRAFTALVGQYKQMKQKDPSR